MQTASDFSANVRSGVEPSGEALHQVIIGPQQAQEQVLRLDLIAAVGAGL